MAKKRVNLTIDEELNERWNKVAKQLGWNKSAMVEDFLREALPFLENLHPKDIIPRSVQTIGQKLMELGYEIERSQK